MKFLFLILIIAFIFGCQKDNNDDGGDVKICCSGPAQMDFKTHSGREIVSLSEVTGADIKIAATAKDSGLERTFVGSQAQTLLKQFNLWWPAQNGFLSGLVSGSITIYYTHRGSTEARTRVIEIMNSYALQDSVFPDVTYDPGLTLDVAWLKAQK